MYVLIVKKLSSVVRQLAERHARLKGELARREQLVADASARMQRLQRFLADASARVQRLQSEVDATALLLTTIDKRVAPAQIAPVNGVKGRYGAHGGLKAAILKLVEQASPAGIATGALSLLVRHEFDLEFPTCKAAERWFVSSLRPHLRRMVKAGLLEKTKVGPRHADAVRWHLAKPACAPSLDDLRAQAAAAGLATTS